MKTVRSCWWTTTRCSARAWPSCCRGARHRGGGGQPAPNEAARLAETQPDLLMLDLNMPPHGGLALLRTLQDTAGTGRR